MKSLHFTIAKNVIANLVRGGASAIVALALPHFLVKSLDHDRFAAWALLLQIAAYATYLDFGVQTAVSRFVARYMELGDERRRNSLVSTALAFLIVAAVLAVAIFGVIVWSLPHFFPGVPAHLLTELRYAVLIMGVGASCLLPLSTFSGVLVGLHRNEHVALAIGGSRLLGAIIVVFAARQTTSLLVFGACIAGLNLLGGAVQVLSAKHLLPSLQIRWSCIQRTSAVELGKFCTGLTVWSISMFLVTGVGVTIVGTVDFQAVGYYSVAAALVTVFSGANSAVCSAFITPVAALHASRLNDRIRTLVITATRANTFANLLVTTVMFMSGHFILRMWVGEIYARQALPILELLMVGNAVRLIANPYASMLIATGQQRHGIAQGLVESLTNLGSSIIGALWLGPIGVAWGTVIGAICVVIWTCVVTLKRATEISLSRWSFVFEGIIRPFICTLPLVLFSTTMHCPMSLQSAELLGVCALLTGILTSRFGKVLPTSQWLRKRFFTG
jgi:O-antigen/teichoic acid export membrane protein